MIVSDDSENNTGLLSDSWFEFMNSCFGIPEH